VYLQRRLPRLLISSQEQGKGLDCKLFSNQKKRTRSIAPQ
jgi:hypothetical protein